MATMRPPPPLSLWSDLECARRHGRGGGGAGGVWWWQPAEMGQMRPRWEGWPPHLPLRYRRSRFRPGRRSASSTGWMDDVALGMTAFADSIGDTRGVPKHDQARGNRGGHDGHVQGKQTSQDGRSSHLLRISSIKHLFMGGNDSSSPTSRLGLAA